MHIFIFIGHRGLPYISAGRAGSRVGIRPTGNIRLIG
jgi:hypothetical protein